MSHGSVTGYYMNLFSLFSWNGRKGSVATSKNNTSVYLYRYIVIPLRRELLIFWEDKLFKFFDAGAFQFCKNWGGGVERECSKFNNKDRLDNRTIDYGWTRRYQFIMWDKWTKWEYVCTYHTTLYTIFIGNP